MDRKREGHASGEGGLEALVARFLAFDLIIVLLALGVGGDALRQGAVLLGGLLLASSGVLLAGVFVSVGAVLAFTGVGAGEGHRPSRVAATGVQAQDVGPDA